MAQIIKPKIKILSSLSPNLIKRKVSLICPHISVQISKLSEYTSETFNEGWHVETVFNKILKLHSYLYLILKRQIKTSRPLQLCNKMKRIGFDIFLQPLQRTGMFASLSII